MEIQECIASSDQNGKEQENKKLNSQTFQNSIQFPKIFQNF